MKKIYLHMKSGKTYQIDPESVVSESGQKIHLDKLNHWDIIQNPVVYATQIERAWAPETDYSHRNTIERRSKIMFSLSDIEVIETDAE